MLMVLLELTDRLRDRLESLAPRLPTEIRSLIAAHLSSPADRALATGQVDGPDVNARVPAGTIPHRVLSEVSDWAKTQDHHHLHDRGQAVPPRRLLLPTRPDS